MAYPAAIESFATKTDNVDTVHAAHVNALQTSIVNIETELGITPSGAYDDVAGRLDAIEGVLNNVWIPDTDTWKYASATTFTITGNQTAKFARGTKLKLTQTTVKYFYVVSASYSSPNTTVTVTGGVDYTLANAAITATYYSNQLVVPGFATNGLFDWSGASGINIQGFSGTPTQNASFSMLGGLVVLYMNITGTSSADTMTGTLPVTPTVSGRFPVRSRNNKSDYDWGEVSITASSNTVTFYKNAAEAAWAASNTKAIQNARIIYQ